MSVINTVPKGLQEFLGNTSQGRNPSNILADVRPTLDMAPYWDVDKIKFYTQSGAVLASYNNQAKAVPDGEVWIPLAISCNIDFASATDEAAITLQLASPSGVVRGSLATGYRASSVAGTNSHTVCWSSGQRIALSGGTQIIGLLDFLSIPSGVRNMALDIIYVELKA